MGKFNETIVMYIHCSIPISLDPVPVPESTEIWLDNVVCITGGTTLFSCSHGDVGVHNCDHSMDVALVCLSK